MLSKLLKKTFLASMAHSWVARSRQNCCLPVTSQYRSAGGSSAPPSVPSAPAPRTPRPQVPQAPPQFARGGSGNYRPSPQQQGQPYQPQRQPAQQQVHSYQPPTQPRQQDPTQTAQEYSQQQLAPISELKAPGSEAFEIKPWDPEQVNMVKLAGRVVSTPDYKQYPTSSKTVVELEVRASKGKPSRFKVDFWNSDAERARNIALDMMIGVDAKLVNSTWKTAEGAPRSKTSVVGKYFWLVDNPPPELESSGEVAMDGPSDAEQPAKEPAPLTWEARKTWLTIKHEQCWRMYHEQSLPITEIATAQSLATNTTLQYIIAQVVGKNFPINWANITQDCALCINDSSLTLVDVVEAVKAGYEEHGMDPMTYEMPIKVFREQLERNPEAQQRLAAQDAQPTVKKIMFSQLKLANELYRYHLMKNPNADYVKINQQALDQKLA